MAAAGSHPTEHLDYTRNVNYWADRWTQEKIGWHKSVVNKQLIENLPKLCAGASKTFFIPLCGKSVDIPYLYERGHRVFGVEAIPKAIEELNTEHSLGLTFDLNTSTYATDDGKIIIYLGDIFKCPFEKFGPFDCVWDRGSFVAFEYPFRPAYKEMVQRSLKVRECGSTKSYHNFKYLLEAFEYDREKYPGPPRAINAEDMETFFGDWANIEVIQRVPETIASQPDIGKVELVYYLLTPKT